MFDFQKLNEQFGIIGAQAVVIKNGAISEFAYGYADLENHVPMTVTTPIRIASISKTVLALGVVKLYETGQVDFNRDLSDYLGFKLRNPKFPNVPITLKHIMTQTSSIHDGDEQSGYDAINGTYQTANLEDLLLESGKLFSPKTFGPYRPGTHFAYSNFGCGIMACVIERITGIDYNLFMKDHIFDPLGLDASFRPRDIKASLISSTYDQRGRIERTGQSFCEAQYPVYPVGSNFRGPAGGLFISGRDLAQILKLFLNDGAPLFKPETLQTMYGPHWVKGSYNEDPVYDAKGLQLLITDRFAPYRLFGHFGDAYGVASFMLFDPSRKTGIVYIANGGCYQYQTSGIKDVHEAVIKAFINEYLRYD